MKGKLYLPALLLVLLSFQVRASMPRSKPHQEKIENMTDSEKQVRLEEIKARVNEIKAMDKSNLTTDQKKVLKAELKEMKSEARIVRGVYISIGALIIIILLLIIIL